MVNRNFFIQWDATNDCNLKCSHCYHNREGGNHSNHIQDNNFMDFDEVKNMIDDLNDTAKRWDFAPRFQISGGEPLMRKDIMKILDYTFSQNIETRLLTNGTLITKNKAKELYEKNIKRLQISIDGSRERHNKIRKRDYAYDQAMEGVKNSSEAGILVNVSMTAMQSNKEDLENVIINSIKAGAGIVGFQSYVPDKNLGVKDPEFVDGKETYKLFQETRRLNDIYGNKIRILQTEVLWQTMQWDTKIKQEARKTQKFLSGCGAGWSGISVLSDGTIYPCRRLPIPLGNIKKDKLVDIMINNEVMQNLRDFQKMKEGGCCEDIPYCRGCRAVAYATTGDYMKKDPMCPKEFVKPEEIKPRVIRR